MRKLAILRTQRHRARSSQIDSGDHMPLLVLRTFTSVFSRSFSSAVTWCPGKSVLNFPNWKWELDIESDVRPIYRGHRRASVALLRVELQALPAQLPGVGCGSCSPWCLPGPLHLEARGTTTFTEVHSELPSLPASLASLGKAAFSSLLSMTR